MKIYFKKSDHNFTYFLVHTVKDENLCSITCFWSKTTLIASSVCEIGVNPPLEKLTHFVLGPWLLVCQFIDICNQMETTGEVSSVEQKIYIMRYYVKKIPSIFDTSPVVSIWLEMSINWHTKSQGPKTKCVNFSKGRIDPYLAHTARN